MAVEINSLRSTTVMARRLLPRGGGGGRRLSSIGRHCSWSALVPTSVFDSHSRSCAFPLPAKHNGGDGNVLLVGDTIPKLPGPLSATTIVLSLASYGLNFSKACGLCAPTMASTVRTMGTSAGHRTRGSARGLCIHRRCGVVALQTRGTRGW